MDQHVVDAGHLRNKNLQAYMNSCVENQTLGFSDTKPSSTKIIKKDIKEGHQTTILLYHSTMARSYVGLESMRSD
jgi:hypothetical protein